jgi:hypothetical protein
MTSKPQKKVMVDVLIRSFAGRTSKLDASYMFLKCTSMGHLAKGYVYCTIAIIARNHF